MRVQIKELDNKNWKRIKPEKLVGTTIFDYLVNNENRVVVGVYGDEEEKPSLFISNNEVDIEEMKKKGVSLSVQELSKLMETQCVPQVVVEVFPDSEMLEVRSL